MCIYYVYILCLILYYQNCTHYYYAYYADHLQQYQLLTINNIDYNNISLKISLIVYLTTNNGDFN
jgi:hypothetical protein